MLLKTLMYDSTSTTFENDTEYNIMFLRMQESHINEFIKVNGYIYLNTIYEQLGFKWNPEEENVCVKHYDDAHAFVEFEVFPKDNNNVLVNIYARS